LSLAREDEYRSSGIPTPAVRYGEPATRVLIVAFFAALTGIVTAAAVTGLYGLPYLAVALAALLILWSFVARLLTARTSVAAWALFKVSGPCLAALVAAAVADQLL
jgi:heme O synthase-like polyprenyltransferase